MREIAYTYATNGQLQLMWSQLDDCGLDAVNVVSVAVNVVSSVALVAINVVSKFS